MTAEMKMLKSVTHFLLALGITVQGTLEKVQFEHGAPNANMSQRTFRTLQRWQAFEALVLILFPSALILTTLCRTSCMCKSLLLVWCTWQRSVLASRNCKLAIIMDYMSVRLSNCMTTERHRVLDDLRLNTLKGPNIGGKNRQI